MRNIVTSFVITMILVATLIIAFNIRPVQTAPTTIVGPDDNPTIQEAVNTTNYGDTIFVGSSTYYDNIAVSAPRPGFARSGMDINVHCVDSLSSKRRVS